jgi:outer membrane receptor protein involved in Fe transport
MPTDSHQMARLWASRLLRPLFLSVAVFDIRLAAAAAAEGGDPPASGPLQEIVVTATRREESISKVPISITALSQDDLDQKGIRDFSEMVRFTPGVSIDTSGTNAISIRGISTSGGAGTTGIYIDDTPIQMRSVGFNPDDALPKTFDMERVEVLRGPQGTLFGAGSEGGTVRYIMAEPSLTTASTYLRSEMSYTEHGEPSYEAGIAQGGPIIDGVLGFRASIWTRHDGGWVNRVDDTTGAITEANANYTNTEAGRLALLYQPMDNVQITGSIYYQNELQHDWSTYWPTYSNPNAGEFNDATPERKPIPDRFYLPALKVQVDLGHMELISNTSYYHRDEISGYEGTVYALGLYQSYSWVGVTPTGVPACGTASTTPAPPCSWYPLIGYNGIHLPAGFTNYSEPAFITNQQRTVTQEVRLQSTDDGSAWKWTLGTFWNLAREVSTEEQVDTFLVPFWTALFGSSPLVNPPWIGSNGLAGYYCNGVGAVVPGLPNCEVYYDRQTGHDRQIAAFGEVTYSFSEQWKLTAGGRFAHMSYDLSQYGNGVENAGAEGFSGSYHQNAFTPKLSLSFQETPHNLYYATFSKGFRPGGVNAPEPVAVCGATPPDYKSDSTQNFELGTKDSFANRLRVEASLYYIKWNGIQENVYNLGATGNCGFQYTDNLGGAVAKGFDLQIQGTLIGSLSLDAAVGYTSARYTSSNSVSSAGDAIAGQAAINYAPGASPPWNIALGPQYSFPVAGHDAFVRLDWEYASRNPWLSSLQDPKNASQYNPYTWTLPATSFMSMRAGIKLGNWQVSAFADNLLGAHPVTNYAQGIPDANNPNGPLRPEENDFTFRPRTIGLTATFRQ